MRTTSTSISIVALSLGCVFDPVDIARFTADADEPLGNDDHEVDSGGGTEGVLGADCEECPPHPYLGCVAPQQPSDVHPACELKCNTLELGRLGGDGFAWCDIECADDSDCLGWGGAAVSCDDGVCMWYCDFEADCPNDLDCVDRHTTGAETSYWGECWAPRE